MRLILIRHGQAEDASYDHTDVHRALTANGRERLENAYPSLARFLNTKSHCEVWTSPKTRALQTAEVLCRYTPHIFPEVKDFLAEGDFDAFCQALSTLDHGMTIVVIGHEPYLSNWLREMTRMDVMFRKGRGEMLYLAPQRPRDAIRISDLSFGKMADLKLFTVPMGIGIETMIQNQHKKIIEARDHFLDDPDDSEALSRLRVALRSQYALIEFLRPYCTSQSFELAEEHYLSLYEDLEELRSINAILKTIHNSRKLELAPLADALVVEQNSAVMDLCDQLSQPESEAAYSEALHLIMAALMTVQRTEPLEQLVREQFISRYHLVQEAVLSTDFTNLADTEALRALCKTSRYLFEFFSPLADYRQAKQYLRIRRLNQRLSTYCDTFYNMEHLHALFEDHMQPGVDRAMNLYAQMMAKSAADQLDVVDHLIEEVRQDVAHTDKAKADKKKTHDKHDKKDKSCKKKKHHGHKEKSDKHHDQKRKCTCKRHKADGGDCTCKKSRAKKHKKKH
ncbi:MAG: CHAD domain-containing protein [Peptococcaceae bacterium]|nr:CHAD domain-containing protein [Peptococcaceae bacterium]